MTASCALPRVRAKFPNVTRAASRLLTSGTKEFANHIGLKPPTLRRTTNKRDPIPHLPGKFRAFISSKRSGDEHTYVFCPGMWPMPYRNVPFGGTPGPQR